MLDLRPALVSPTVRYVTSPDAEPVSITELAAALAQCLIEAAARSDGQGDGEDEQQRDQGCTEVLTE